MSDFEDFWMLCPNPRCEAMVYVDGRENHHSTCDKCRCRVDRCGRCQVKLLEIDPCLIATVGTHRYCPTCQARWLDVCPWCGPDRCVHDAADNVAYLHLRDVFPSTHDRKHSGQATG